MVTDKWLTLQEYSNKYKISISTLRRRIKTRDIEYTFNNGRYLLRASSENFSKGKMEQTSFKELKDLYQGLLDDKDREIDRLKTEMADLNQLVQFLEQEKDRLEEIYKESDFRNPNL